MTKNFILCFMIGSGMAFNAMAALNDTQTGGAFTVLEPKVSNGQNIKGCPTIETPLFLSFERRLLTEYTDIESGGKQYHNPWKMNINSAPSAADLKDLQHEIHVYIELFDLPTGKFASNDVFSYYDANQNVIVTNGKNLTKWEKLTDKKYKLVLRLSSESGDQEQIDHVYALSRNFKTLEIFHFQNVRAYEWEQRNNYAKIKEMVRQMPSSVLIDDLDYIRMYGNKDTSTRSLYLYQLLGRTSAKDTNVSFEQKRGFLYPQTRFWIDPDKEVGTDMHSRHLLNAILIGGRELQSYQDKFHQSSDPEFFTYSMSDNDSFKNFLKLESFNFRLMNGNKIGLGHIVTHGVFPRLNLAQYKSSEFKMTEENAKLCGLN